MATVSTVSGTHAAYGRPATWPSFNVYGLRDGKISELRGLDDLFAQCKQLGYVLTPPAKA